MSHFSKEEKLRLMFEHLDKDKDGVLSRGELKGLILTVNSHVEFTEFELEVVLDEMFRRYPHCVKDGGLNMEGFASTYKDGAGNVDRDFAKLLGSDPANNHDSDKKVQKLDTMDADGLAKKVPDRSQEQAAPKSPVAEAGDMKEDFADVSQEVAELQAAAAAMLADEQRSQQVQAADLADRRQDAVPPPSSASPPHAQHADALKQQQKVDKEDSQKAAINSRVEKEDSQKAAIHSRVEKEDSQKAAINSRVYEEQHVLQLLVSESPRLLAAPTSPKARADASPLVSGAPKPLVDIPLVPGAHAIVEELRAALAAAPRATSAKLASSNGSVIEVTQELHDKIRALRLQAGALGNAQQEHQVHMDMGHLLSQHAVFDEALGSFGRAMGMEPADPRAMFRTANILYSLGDVEKAVNNYDAALKVCQAAGHIDLAHKVHINMGIALEAKGMLMNACEHYREAAILVPNNPRALKLLGSAMFGLGELRSAEEALQHALHLQPDYVDAYCDLGATLTAVGDTERALDAFNHAIAIDPNHVQVLFNLANLHRGMGEFDKAIVAYDRVVAREPRHWRAHLNKAISLVALGQSKPARAAIEEAYKLSGMRIELYDEMKAINKMSKQEAQQLSLARAAPERLRTNSGTLKGYQPARLRGFSSRTMTRQVTSGRFTLRDLADAIDVPLLQQLTPITKIDVKQMVDAVKELHKREDPGNSRNVRKPVVEAVLRGMLPTLPAVPFQYLMKAINGRTFPILDWEKLGTVDLALLLAVLVHLTGAPPQDRKSAAYDMLLQRAGGIELTRGTVRRYITCLIGCYSYESTPVQYLAGENDITTVNRFEFFHMLDDVATGFPYIVSLPQMAHRHGWEV